MERRDILVAVGVLTGDDVLLSPKQIADRFLLDMGEFLVELVCESKCNDG